MRASPFTNLDGSPPESCDVQGSGTIFAGIDVASEPHVLAPLDGTGRPLGRPIAIDEDAGGCRMIPEALGPPPAPVVLEATTCRSTVSKETAE